MKEKINILLVLIVIAYGCKKDTAVQLTTNTEKVFKFENSSIKMETASTTYPPKGSSDIHFFDEFEGITITAEGKIFKTNDQGNSWTLKYETPITNQSLRQILFTDKSTGFVVGGADWCDGTDCICPGGVVLKTTDGGETWKSILQVPGNIKFDGIASNALGDLFLIQSGYSGPSQPLTKILKSIDGGINWTNAVNFNLPIAKIVFNGNNGFCTGANTFKSTDNGNTWSNITTLADHWTSDIVFNNNIGYCIVDNHLAYKTIDYGNNWLQIFDSPYNNSFKLHLLSTNSCLLFGAGMYSGGCFGYCYGAVRQTTNAGYTWEENQFKDIESIRFVSFYEPTKAYLIAGKLIKLTVK